LILGIGTDLCSVTRIKRSITRFGDRFKSKFCTEQERRRIDVLSDPGIAYAQSFAAKEAIAKALGTGFDEDVDPVEIELLSLMAPIDLRLAGAASARLSDLTPNAWASVIHVSVGTWLDFASATAVVSALRSGYGEPRPGSAEGTPPRV